MPKMYDELAAWWPLLSPPGDYEEEAAFYANTLAAACKQPINAVLELGSGGGNNASHLKTRWLMTLVEPSAGMRAVSQGLNPDLEHIEGDMRTIRLGREFDAVFVHDAVCYMTAESDVRLAIETTFEHCRIGGAVLFCPDYVRENFRPGTECGGHDGGGRAMRYLEWVWDPDPSDTVYLVDYVFALRDRDGAVRIEHDRHVEGLFPRADWIRWLSDAGFVGARSVPFEHSELEPGSHEVFVGGKPDA
jgi:SAM-dependent methyltransferase